jgi:hypothetical protein
MKIHLTMGDQPNRNWGTGPGNQPATSIATLAKR